MKKSTLFIIPNTCSFLFSANTQTAISNSISSEVLNQVGQLRIHLPKSFEVTEAKTYPLILTLDAEYMFYSVIGNTEQPQTNVYILDAKS